MTEGEEIQVGDYVAYNVSGNTEHGTVVSAEGDGYIVTPDNGPQGSVVAIGSGAATKVQRGQ